MDACLTGTRTFRILCKQSKYCRDNEDVARIVRDYLIVSISQMSDLLWRFVVPKLPPTYTPYQYTIHESVCWVNSAILADADIGEEDETLAKIGDHDAWDLDRYHDLQLRRNKESKRSKTKTAVSVIIDIRDCGSNSRDVRWSVKWGSLDTMKYWSAAIPIGREKIVLDMINVISCIRHAFDKRLSGPGDTKTRMEVPTTRHEWDDFIIQQLFGHTRMVNNYFGPQRLVRSTTRNSHPTETK